MLWVLQRTVSLWIQNLWVLKRTRLIQLKSRVRKYLQFYAEHLCLSIKTVIVHDLNFGNWMNDLQRKVCTSYCFVHRSTWTYLWKKTVHDLPLQTFWPRSRPTERRSWSGSELFDGLISVLDRMFRKSRFGKEMFRWKVIQHTKIKLVYI